MVGDGSERKAMENLVTELGIAAQVTFWGQQLDVAPFLSAADAFIMSSNSEGLPISLLQAFSLGLPAVVTDVGGMAEIVRGAKAGVIVPADDSAAMAGAIVQLAANDSESAQYSANAAEAFNSGFTLQIMTDAYMDLYRNTALAPDERKDNARSPRNEILNLDCQWLRTQLSVRRMGVPISTTSKSVTFKILQIMR